MIICFFNLYDNMFGTYWDFANFPKMLPSMPKGKIVVNMTNQSNKMIYVFFIYGNIFFTVQ